MEFSGQEYWSGLPFPSPGDLPDPGIKPGSPALQADALTSRGRSGGVVFPSLSEFSTVYDDPHSQRLKIVHGLKLVLNKCELLYLTDLLYSNCWQRIDIIIIMETS